MGDGVTDLAGDEIPDLIEEGVLQMPAGDLMVEVGVLPGVPVLFGMVVGLEGVRASPDGVILLVLGDLQAGGTYPGGCGLLAGMDGGAAVFVRRLLLICSLALWAAAPTDLNLLK
jgi:hypothetical protein